MMAVEAEAASEVTNEINVQAPLIQTPQSSSTNGTIRVSISSFGVIEIDRGGIISNDSGDFSVGEIAVENKERSLASDSLNGNLPMGGKEMVHDISSQGPRNGGINPDTLQPLPGTTEQGHEEPILSAGEDRALQDIDTTFFDTLRRGTGNDDTCIDWSTWLNDLQPPHGHSGI